MDEQKSVQLTQLLINNDCLKFGEFKLKNGASSDYYVDLRESTENYTLFDQIAQVLIKLISKSRNSDKQAAIVGVPYGVVPLAAVVAHGLKMPYFPVRKETKNYGNKASSNKLLDHDFILIEDVMSSGSSIIETVDKMDGKRVTDVFVVVDREAGGVQNIGLKYPNIRVHSVLSANQILSIRGRLCKE